jgi:hypothetical protein
MLVTVDDTLAVASAEPRWLDVVRWETCRIDASGARDGDEVLARFQDRLSRLLAGCEDRLLALRVEVQGACPAHPTLAAHSLHWTSEVRQAAIDTGSGRVWVEKVLFRTAAMRSLLDDVLGDAPLAELAGYLDELRADDAQLTAVGAHALEDLTRKLPAELLDGLDSPERLRDLLDQAGPLLFERLLGQTTSGTA